MEGADDALKERLVAVPFDQYVEPENRDPYLVEKILAEKSGVLNWMLNGYRDVMANPSIIRELPAECVEAANEMYRSMNLYQRWLDDETVPSGDEDKQNWITVEESWQSFTAWCHDQRETSGTKHKLGRALTVEGHPSEPVREDSKQSDRTVRRRKGITWSPEHHERAAREAAREASSTGEHEAPSALTTAQRVAALSAEAELGA